MANSHRDRVAARGTALALTRCAINFSSDRSIPAQLAVWRETVSIDRNIANDIELAVTVSSYFADTGSWLIHILTVIWGS